MTLRSSLTILALTGLVACAAQTDKTVKEERQEQKPLPLADQSIRIAPGRCRIVATIVSVDSMLEGTGPCSKAPCRAVVRVDSILGYGSAFGNPVAVNSQIQLRFAFTLAPTSKDLFPNMTDRFPGLDVGSKFQTDIESRMEMGKTDGPRWYLVYDYKKMN